MATSISSSSELASAQLAAENQQLLARLAAAEDTLRAIQANEVDGLMVGGNGRQRLYTLRGADEGYRIFVEAMPQGVATIGEDGTILYSNQFLAALLGQPLEQTIGSSVYDFIDQEDEGRLRALLWEGLSRGNIRGTFSLRKANGAAFSGLLTVTPLVLEGVRCVGLIVSDLTEHEARLSAEAANRAKDRFLAILSHELRTPLTPVLMAVAALEGEPNLPQSVRQDLEMIRRNVELETRLIEDLLDLSRATSGKLRLQTQPLSLHALARTVVEMLKGELDQKRLTVRWALDAKQDRIKGDAARLQQVLWNLLKNAIKFSGEAQSICIRSRNEGEKGIRIEVADEGTGIAPSVMPHIFSAFEQGGSGESGPAGGLGLGLTIAKAIVDLHGGSIDARSDGRGCGSCFGVTLPVSADRPRKAVPAEARPQPPTTASVRLLLVEDHAETAHLLVRLLSRAGHSVKSATSVAEALELAAAEPFDLLLSDIGLPDSSGYDLMQRIRAQHGIPGIALTGYGMEQDLRRSREAGFADHVVKPIDLAELQAVIARVVSSVGA